MGARGGIGAADGAGDGARGGVGVAVIGAEILDGAGKTGVTTGLAGTGVAGRAGVAVATGVGMNSSDSATTTESGAYASGAAAASDSVIARETGADHALPPPAPAATSAAGAPARSAPATCITAPQTEHRARTPPAGTFAGSTRKTD